MFETFLLSFIPNAYIKSVIIALITFSSVSVAFHIIVVKKDPRSALGWLMFVISAPIIGAVAYVFFGINRIQRKAVKLDLGVKAYLKSNKSDSLLDQSIKSKLMVGEALSYSPFCSIESVTPLNTGDEAYPQMLQAIRDAKESISFFSYIFVVDSVGQEFIEALIEAKKRGVKVCVLVDGVGSQSTLGRLSSQMETASIDFSVFLPVLFRPRLVNMRNHRKILVVDGIVAFTGGINIEEIYWPARSSHQKVLDFHFKFEGPIVNYIQAVFAEDWFYCTEKTLEGEIWFNPIVNKVDDHSKFARVVVGGPGVDNEKIQWHFINLVNQAKKRIMIATPYFLPSVEISTVLIAAAQRGVEVDVIIPSAGDHPVISWATEASLHQLLEFGCRIWQSPPPFDHSKIFVIDKNCSSVGSANWDIRSLRLNFEMNIEVYSEELAEELTNVFESKKKHSKQYTQQDYETRSLFVKLRGGVARLGSAYL